MMLYHSNLFCHSCMDWSLCIICQEKQPSEPLKCPLNSLQHGTGFNAYETFLETVVQFREANCLPVNLAFKEDQENAQYFVDNRASWHKSCHLKFSKTKLDKALSKKRKRDDCSDTSRRESKRHAFNIDVCIFCEKGNDDLHQVTTFPVDNTVRTMAADLQDMELMSKLGGTDMIASEAKYHRNCMRSFKNRYRSLLQKKSPNNSNEREQIAEARAFSELVTYMECSAENGVHIFKLSELHQLYVKRLETFDIIKTVNKTRLKNQLLGHFCENVKEQSDGRNVVLIFSDALQSLLKNALTSRDFQSEAFDFTSVAKTIRSEIFENDGINFNGAFANGCQIDGVPPNLLYFVSLLLNGSNIQEQPSDVSQACLTIAQMIVFNSKKMPKASGKTRHSKIREPPLPIYNGLNIHTQTRSRMLVDNLYQLGLSVSYDRVTEIINGLATSVCLQYKADNIVCPSNLRHGLYTVGALDNIDHNPSSTTSQGSFHGTGISVFEFPTEDEPGISRPTINLPNKDQANDFTLPDNYATVPSVNIKTSNITINTSNNNPREIKGNLVGAVEQENCWIEHSLPLLETNLVKGNYVSWSAYHASLVDSSKESPAISSLLPMFNEKAASVSMVKHGMDVLCNLTSYLNPGQVPVRTADQPLYAISKYVQWQWPATYGENVFVTMLGGLHIEMALWSLCGDLLDCSGWTNALTDAGVASSGTSESFLKVSHLARTRHAHQVTVLALSKL